jgi:F-type H+-transporting ATPase subunit b
VKAPLLRKICVRSAIRKYIAAAFLFLSSATQAIAESPAVQPSHGAEGHGGAHSSGGLPQLDPSTFESQIVWLIIIFSLLYFIFSKQSLPEIAEVIETRSERIRSDLDSADELKSQVETVQKAYEENLEKARLDAVNTYKDAELNIKANVEKEQKAFYVRSSEQIAEMERKIENETSAAMKGINEVAAEVAEEAAKKIIGTTTRAAKAA